MRGNWGKGVELGKKVEARGGEIMSESKNVKARGSQTGYLVLEKKDTLRRPVDEYSRERPLSMGGRPVSKPERALQCGRCSTGKSV